MKELADVDGRKTVCTPATLRFVWAICSSLSKSDTARRPFTMKSAPSRRARVTTNSPNMVVRTFGRCANVSFSMASRCSMLNSVVPFWGLRIAATITSSNSSAAISTSST